MKLRTLLVLALSCLIGAASAHAQTGYPDGFSGAPAGTAIQRPTLLSAYANPPPWSVAGVAYPVGIPASVALTDWQAFSHAGCVVSTAAGTITCTNTDGVVFSGIDFTLHNGASIVLSNSNNDTITNSKFGGSHLNTVVGAIVQLTNGSQGLTFTYNVASGPAVPTNSQTALLGVLGGTSTVEYNWFLGFPNAVLSVGSGAAVPTMKYNLFDNGTRSTTGLFGYLVWNGTGSLAPDVEFNTAVQTASVGGDGFQFFDTTTGQTIVNPAVLFNTVVTAKVGGVNALTNVFHGSSEAAHTTTLTGHGRVNSNYFDLSGATSAFSTSTSWNEWSGVIDTNMVSGAAVAFPAGTFFVPTGCVMNQPCVQNERTGKVYTLTNGNSFCYLSDGPVNPGDRLCPWAAAAYDSQPGDTFDVYPAIYGESDVQILWNVNYKGIGAAPDLSGPGQIIRDPSANWRPGTDANAGNNCVKDKPQPGDCPLGPTPAGNGLIAKGAVVIARTGLAPNTTFTNIQFQNATNVNVPLTGNLQATIHGAIVPQTLTLVKGNAGSIASFQTFINGTGSVTSSLQLNGANVAGCANITLTLPTSVTTPCTPTTFGATDTITWVLSAVSGAPVGTGSSSVKVQYNVSTFNCNGSVLPAGHPVSCGGDGTGALVSLGGDVTCNNCGFLRSVNGLFTDPFIWGSGTAICNGCLLQYNGSGSGQTHTWYCSREGHCQLNNSISLDTFNGEGFKNRGYSSQVVNSMIGDSSACRLNTWVAAFLDGGASVAPGNGTANMINAPDAGQLIATNDTFCKDGAVSTNGAVSDYGAAVGPWPNTFWHESGSTFKALNLTGGNQYLWNPTLGSDVSIAGLMVQGSTPVWGIMGLGTITGATVNGAPWSGGSHINWPPLSQGNGGEVAIDLRGTTTPQTVSTMPNNQVILGGSGRLTTSVNNADQINPGPGGADVTQTIGGSDFIDLVGAAPSTYTLPCGPLAGFIHTDGDTYTNTGACGKGFLSIGGRNITENSCDAGGAIGGNCNTVMWKATENYVPSGVIHLRGASENQWCINGCNVQILGTLSGAGDYFRFHAVPDRAIAPDEIHALINVTLNNLANKPVAVNYVGCGVYFEAGQILDHTDKTCRSFFYMINTPLPITSENSTTDFGASVGSQVNGEPKVLIASQGITTAAILGSGTSTFDPGAGPGFVQIIPASDTGITGGYNADIMPAHLSGGTMTVVSYNSAVAAQTYISPIAGITMTGCSTAGSTDTLTFSDGSKLTLTNAVACPSVNFGPPPGWTATASLNLPATATGNTGSVIPAPATWADTSANGFVGEVFAKFCATHGQIVFNGKTGPAAGCVTQAGRPEDVTPAVLAAQLIVGTGPTDTVTASVCDQFNVCGSDTMTVSVGGAPPPASSHPRVIQMLP